MAGNPSRDKERADLQADRRRLLEYALEVYRLRGGKLFLPIGMTSAAPWLLDSVDVQALLTAMQSGATIELVEFCNKAMRRTLSNEQSDVMGGADADDAPEAPQLNIPQSKTDLGEGEIKDLAYLVFAANCRNAAEAELLATIRSQLDIDEAHAAEVERLLQLVLTTLERMKAATGKLPVGDNWTACLELPVCMLGLVLPKDFTKFRTFVVWRDTLSHVLLATAQQAVRDAWAPKDGSANAQRLLARLKAALRRTDVRSADDFDEGEYRDASRSVGEHTYALVQCCSSGWAFPWGLRARLAEMLLRGVFDTLDEGAYIPEADEYLALLQRRLWPLLGITPAMHNAGFAWIHFRQYVLTREQGLMNKTKTFIKRLAQEAPKANGVQAPSHADDTLLMREVVNNVIDWAAERLGDYHAARIGPEPAGSDPGAVASLVDVMVCAAQSRGDSAAAVAELLLSALHASVDKEYERRVKALPRPETEAARITALCTLVAELADEEANMWAQCFSTNLPQAPALVLARLHGLFGGRYLPFLGAIEVLEDDKVEAVKAAMELEPQLLGPVQQAALSTSSQTPARVREALVSAVTWDTPAQLQPVMARWVASQIRAFNQWVERQLETERWRPLGPGQPHAASARELRRIVLESLDALFGMGLAIPAHVVAMHMEGIDGLMQQYLKALLARLGPPARLVPAAPPLVRYKREVSVAQENAERSMPGLPRALPPADHVTKKGDKFLETTPRIETEPAAREVEALTLESLAVRLGSLHYLLDMLGPIGDSVHKRWIEEQEQHAQRRTSGANSSTSGHGSSGGGISSGGGGMGSNGMSGMRAGNGYGSRANGGGVDHRAMFEAMLQGAEQSIRSGAAHVAKWLSSKVVWWDMRAQWCELLYRHRVFESRMDGIIEQLGDALGELAELLPPEPRLQVASALLRECAAAIERVLLDGGPCRVFIPADADCMQQDVARLRTLFYADGDGLDTREIDATLSRVKELLTLMATETGDLIHLHSSARNYNSTQPPKGGLAKPSSSSSVAPRADEGVLLRVLCHRADHPASKYLKTNFKLPKAREETLGEMAKRLGRFGNK